MVYVSSHWNADHYIEEHALVYSDCATAGNSVFPHPGMIGANGSSDWSTNHITA